MFLPDYHPVICLLQPPLDFGASPCTRLSRAPRLDVTPTSTTTEPPPRLQRDLSPYLALRPQLRWALPISGFVPFFWHRRVRLGVTPQTTHRSPSHPGRGFPCSLTLDSATWVRWRLPVIPCRSLRFPTRHGGTSRWTHDTQTTFLYAEGG